MKNLLLSASALTCLSFSALAADLPKRTAPALAPVPAFTWAGLYVGANLGSLMTRSKGDELVYGYGMTSANGTGVFASANLGYNWQTNNLVVGIEADLGLASTRAQGFSEASSEYNRVKVDYSSLGSLRARLGYSFDRVLVYGTAGLAVANINFVGMHFSDPDITSDGRVSVKGLRTGWIVGAGIEYAISQNYSLKTEALYLGFKNVTSEVATGGCQFGFKRTSGLISRVGINYKF